MATFKYQTHNVTKVRWGKLKLTRDVARKVHVDVSLTKLITSFVHWLLSFIIPSSSNALKIVEVIASGQHIISKQVSCYLGC